MQGGSLSGNKGAGLSIVQAASTFETINLDNMTIQNNRESGVTLGGSASAGSLSVVNSTFQGNGWEEFDLSGGWFGAFSVSGETSFTGNIFGSGPWAAIYIGGLASFGSAPVIFDNDLSGYGNAICNESTTVVNASGNWWGDLSPTDNLSGSVDYTPWLLSGADTSADPSFQGNFSELWVDDDSPQTGTTGRIQEGINLVSGSTVNVAAGTYIETVMIDKPVTVRGATWNVNKNGYTVPANYAWDDTVESIISAPDPFQDGIVVDITNTNDVTFEGFVVQSLHSTGSGGGGNDPHLLRVNARTQTVNNIIVRNNVIGPNTNVDSQDGTSGRMGLYLALPNYSDYDITNSLFTGNTIFDCKGNGNNVFIWGGAEGYSSERGDLTGTVIEDNDIYGSHRSGIEIAGSADNLTIRNNKIHNNTGLPADDPTNLKYGNGLLVIRMGSDKTSSTAEGADHLTIEGNEIYNNEKNGIYMGPINTNHTITGNDISGNGGDGIRVDLEEQYYGGLYPVFDRISNIIADNNNIENNVGGAQVIGTPTNGFVLDAGYNWWGATDGPSGVGPGGGDAVSTNVIYCPWLDAAYPGGAPISDNGLATNLDTGEAFCSIQAAIDDADTQPGHTIEASPGTYNESVTIYKDNLTIQGETGSQPAITGGLKFDTDLAGLTLKNFYVTGNAVSGQNSLVRMYGAITGMTIDNCIFDGEDVSDRLGFSGGQLEGDVTVTNSEFKNILGWALFESKSGSGGDGSAMDTVTFANNYIHDSNGSVVFRGLSTDRTDVVNVYGNTWENIGGANGEQGQHWAALEVNRTIEANVYDNTVNNVSLGEWGEGQALQFWNIDILNVYGNTIINNAQGIFIYGDAGGGLGGLFAVPGGSISCNNIVGNDQYGLEVDPVATGGPLNAESNWWGDANGPTHSSNPGGGGDPVSDNVDFTPWSLGTPPCIGTIIVEKRTDPAGASDNFTFSGIATGTIKDGGQIVVSNLQPGTYASTEIVPNGWELTKITCDDANSSGDVNTATATFVLDPGETVTCTFTNEPVGSVSIEKTQTAGDMVLPGETFFYELAIQHSFEGMVDILIEDILSHDLSYVDNSLNINGTFLTGQENDLLRTSGKLEYSTDMTEVDISFQVQVSEFADIGTLIFNQAFVKMFYEETDIVIATVGSDPVQTKVVPEPATAVLFGFGIVGLYTLIRKRRGRKA